MAVLELLAGAAPARLVAAELLVLVEAPGLDVDGLRDLVDGVVRGLGDAGRDHPGGGRREGARLVLGPAAGVLKAGGRGRTHGRGPLLPCAVLPFHLDLDAEDVARELLP